MDYIAVASTMNHFWEQYWKIAAHIPARSFTSSIRELPLVKSLPGLKLIRHNTSTNSQVTSFLRANFRKGPFSPLYIYQAYPQEILLTVCDTNDAIVGSVRLRPAGTFEENRVHLIDAFCIRPDWRRKGIGSYLLNQIHHAAAAEGVHHAIFLKEGRPLDITGLLPLYSSTYVCRPTSAAAGAAATATATAATPLLAREIDTALAKTLLYSYTMLRPDTFLILNWETTNQKWFHYRAGESAWILACIQNSHQQFKDEMRPIGWMTGWIESPAITEEDRYKAAIDICSAAGAYYNWVWMDSRWPGVTCSNTDFIIDGTFHWYTYQWSTGLIPGRSYCIMS